MREKFAKFRKSGTPRAQKLRALSQRAIKTLQNLNWKWPDQHCIQIRIKQASSVGITQILRPTRAKVLQNFRKKNWRAARTKIAWSRPALLRKAQNVVAVLFRIGLQSNIRWRASPASISRKICAKICAKSLQNSGNPARPAHKNCVHPASVRYKYCTTSLSGCWVSIAFRSESNCQASSAGITQILRPTRAKELQNFRKKSACRAHKNCVKSASVVAQSTERRCGSFMKRF